MPTSTERSSQSRPSKPVDASGEVPHQSAIDGLRLDFLNDPSFIVNPANVITWANDLFLRTFDLKADAVMGKMTCEEACGTHLCGTKNCPVGKAERLGKPNSVEVIRTNDDGEPLYFQSTATPLDGNEKLTLVTLRDITAKKRLESRLDQLETDLNVIPTPIVEIDTQFTVIYMNPSGAAIVGLTPDKVVGRKCYDLFRTPHCKTEKCACARAMKTDSVVSAQTIARPAEGVIVPIKYTGAPIKDAKGNIKGALEFVLDITEEARQRQAAVEKIENLNAIPTPILSIDTEFTITFMNPAGAKVLGMTPEEATGRKCYDLFKTPHCRTEKCACQRAMQTDAIVSEETIARPAEGVIMPIKYTGAPIKDAKGNVKGALEFVLDITLEVSQRQMANEKIENLNAIPTPIHAIDTHHTITYINPAGAAMANVTVEEAIGKKCWELFRMERCRTENCGVDRAMREDAVNQGQTVAHINGRDIPVKATSVSIKDAKGNIKGGLEYMVDVTAETKVERLINTASEEVATLVKDSSIQMDQSSTAMDEMIKSLENEVALLDTSASTVHAMLASAEDMLNMAQEAAKMTGRVSQDAESGKKSRNRSRKETPAHQSIHAVQQRDGGQPGGSARKDQRFRGHHQGHYLTDQSAGVQRRD